MHVLPAPESAAAELLVSEARDLSTVPALLAPLPVRSESPSTGLRTTDEAFGSSMIGPQNR
jgi:hypothetical protein